MGDQRRDALLPPSELQLNHCHAHQVCTNLEPFLSHGLVPNAGGRSHDESADGSDVGNLSHMHDQVVAICDLTGVRSSTIWRGSSAAKPYRWWWLTRRRDTHPARGLRSLIPACSAQGVPQARRKTTQTMTGPPSRHYLHQGEGVPKPHVVRV